MSACKMIEVQTERLWLRQWRLSDKAAFARMNADHEVMEYFPSTLSARESDALMQRLQSCIDQQGWGLWAVEHTQSAELVGFTGLQTAREGIPCAAGIEIGWRLARVYWGRGYATEAAGAALRVAFEQLACQEVFSFTSVHNVRSSKLMQRLGMQDTGVHFMHPCIAADHFLAEHVLYRLDLPRWRNGFGTDGGGR